MTSKPIFKAISAIITTILFGSLMFMLVNSVTTGSFFDDSSKKNTILATVLMIAPIVITIIWSIIRRRYYWALSIVNLFVCAIIGAAMGEKTNTGHAYVYALFIIIPYIFCLKMILKEKEISKPEPYPDSSGYSSSSSSYSGSSYGSSGGSLSFSEKEAYIIRNCHGAYSTSAMEKIENDSSLTESQKTELKNHLFHYGD